MTYYNVGKIVNTQGLQGELRVLSVTDFADERFKKKSVLALFDDKDNYIMDVEVANDVWVVKRKGKKDLLLPYIPPVVLDVDVAAGRIEVELMEGLDDED